MNSKTTTAIT
jgi:hypothetical protein